MLTKDQKLELQGVTISRPCSECEEIVEISVQPMDDDVEAVAPELVMTYRAYWDGPGYEIEFEPLSYEFGNYEQPIETFADPAGQWIKAWMGAHFKERFEHFQEESECFEGYRQFHWQQHQSDRSEFQRARL